MSDAAVATAGGMDDQKKVELVMSMQPKKYAELKRVSAILLYRKLGDASMTDSPASARDAGIGPHARELYRVRKARIHYRTKGQGDRDAVSTTWP